MARKHRPGIFAKVATDLHYVRMFGVRGSRDVRKSNTAEYREYKAAQKRGHKIRKAHRRRR